MPKHELRRTVRKNGQFIMEQSKEMKIDHLNGINGAEKARTSSRIEAGRVADRETSPPTQSSSAVAEINISSRAEAVKRLAEKAAGSPDVRQEHVEALRSLTESGSYRPSAEEIADSIIRSER
jgi:flagellar biosynthesis anti-sigma factor FlgM